jgi:hypothetical protein
MPAHSSSVAVAAMRSRRTPAGDQAQSCTANGSCACPLQCAAAGLRVGDAAEAYQVATANGGEGVLEPQTMHDPASGQEAVVSEIRLFGDCVLRFVSGGFQVRQGFFWSVFGWFFRGQLHAALCQRRLPGLVRRHGVGGGGIYGSRSKKRGLRYPLQTRLDGGPLFVGL